MCDNPAVVVVCAQVRDVLRSQSSVGIRHRDHSVTGNTLKSMNTGLAEYFFGSGLDQKLTFQRFLIFQRQLQREILSLEVQSRFALLCWFTPK